MKHKIKNIDSLERNLPIYDGTDRIIKYKEIIEAEITEKVQYMINNGFFKDLGEVDEVKYQAENTEKKKAKKKNKHVEPFEGESTIQYKKRGNNPRRYD